MIASFDRALNREGPQGSWGELAALDLPGPLINGFAQRRAGMEVVPP